MIEQAFAGAQKVPGALELFIRRDFVDPAACATLIAAIEARRRPSTVADGDGDAGFRTSETCDLDDALPVVAELRARIARFVGLDLRFAEPMQGQRYAVGQEFKLHTDYFEPTGIDYHRFCARSGQRSWTAMVYLNTPDQGGATRFKAIDKIVPAEAGKLLCWNNLTPAGTPNAATLHQGMKVRRGVKYILTLWFREQPWQG